MNVVSKSAINKMLTRDYLNFTVYMLQLLFLIPLLCEDYYSLLLVYKYKLLLIRLLNLYIITITMIQTSQKNLIQTYIQLETHKS